MKLAEALLLRKQLSGKVAQLQPLKFQGDQGLFDTKIKRTPTSQSVDEVTIHTPRITMEEFTKEFDMYATELRKIDAAIQKANWSFDVEYTAPQRLA